MEARDSLSTQLVSPVYTLYDIWHSVLYLNIHAVLSTMCRHHRRRVETFSLFLRIVYFEFSRLTSVGTFTSLERQRARQLARL